MHNFSLCSGTVVRCVYAGVPIAPKMRLGNWDPYVPYPFGTGHYNLQAKTIYF